MTPILAFIAGLTDDPDISFHCWLDRDGANGWTVEGRYHCYSSYLGSGTGKNFSKYSPIDSSTSIKITTPALRF